MSSVDVETLAQRLDEAALHARAIPMLTASQPFDLATAYAIQRAGAELKRLRGDPVVGMKMGLTSRAKMTQMGVHEPIYGHLHRAMTLEEGGTISRDKHVHPRV